MCFHSRLKACGVLEIVPGIGGDRQGALGGLIQQGNHILVGKNRKDCGQPPIHRFLLKGFQRRVIHKDSISGMGIPVQKLNHPLWGKVPGFLLLQQILFYADIRTTRIVEKVSNFFRNM